MPGHRPTSSADARPGAGPWRAGLDPTHQPFPAEALEATVAARFLATAAAFAEADALHSPAGTWTFAELRSDAAAIAAEVGHGEPGDPQPVAILADHDGPLVVAMLATLLAEQVVVVLDPAAPDALRDHVLAECGATVLVHDDVHAEAAEAIATAKGLRTVRLRRDGDAATLPWALHGGPDDAIMLAFTSGTSGLPKGGTITNRVLLNTIRGATDALGIGPADRMPMLFPVSLAVAAYPMFLPLLNGGTLATLDVRSVGLNPVADFLEHERITVAYMAPTVVRFLVDALAGRTFPDLRLVALGGEPVDAEVVELTAKLLGPELIANGFGTTETGVIALWVQGATDPVQGTVPSGYPVPDVDLLLLDDHGDEVEVGGSGEIAVASPHLFAGYWGHPDLTRQVLADDPRGRPGWRLYRTGDLGRLDAQGAVTVLGRLDATVKVRGRFVVLGDVEALLHEQPELADAAVTTTSVDGVTDLAAVVVPAEGALDAAALRARLLADHDGYRIPTRWIPVPEMPRLPNGKVDRRAVAALVEEPAEAAAPATDEAAAERAAWSQTERDLYAIWRLLLAAPRIGRDDDFEHLGGHSLLAAQMLVMVEQQLDVIVPMSTMVDHRTIRLLAADIDGIRTERLTRPSTVAMVQRGDERARPRLWFVHDLPGSAYRVRHLAAHLGADQPVWSFESPFLRGEPNHHEHLDTFVAQYVADLLEAQPEGPYWLAGYSFGGICAYEMARQLRAAGHEVAFVGVVDVGPSYRGPNWTNRHSPPWPYFGVPIPPPPGASASEVVQHYAEMARRSPRGLARHLTLRTGAARPIDHVRFAADLRRHGRVRPEWRLWYAWEEHWKLAVRAWDRTYRYDGTIHLLWASLTGSTDGTMGWGPLVRDLQIHHFDGFHDELLEPAGAPALAAALRPVLDEAIAATTRGTTP